MKLQDCFIGQNVGVSSKSKGVLTGTILSLFEDKDVETSESIWYAVVNTERPLTASILVCLTVSMMLF